MNDTDKAVAGLRGGIHQILGAVRNTVKNGTFKDLPTPMQRLARRLAEADADYIEEVAGEYEGYDDVLSATSEAEPDLGDMPMDWDVAKAKADEEAAREAAAEAAAAAAPVPAPAPALSSPADGDQETEAQRAEREKIESLFGNRVFD